MSPARLIAPLLVAATVAAAVVAAPADAEARPRPAGRKSNFEANKTFGLGLILGQPTGLSGKYFLTADTAFDFAVGGCCYAGRDGLSLHFTYLWHPVSLVSAEAFELPLYFGLGGHFFDFADDRGDDGAGVGLRAPIGVAFDFNNVPLDVFVELALFMDVLYDRYDDDDLYIALNGAIGVRYYFN
jgi:hypothetical protein